jgi:hypothetical protein
MRLPADCRLTVCDALMEAVSIAVRDGHGRALSAYVAALDAPQVAREMGTRRARGGE